MDAGAVIGVLILLGVFLFCMPGLLVLLVILFAIIIPVQAASLLLAVRAVFKEDVTFKSAYFLMAIVLIVTSVVMFVVNNMGFPVWIAYATQFVIGALLLGYMIQADDEPIGVLKGQLGFADHDGDNVGHLDHHRPDAWFVFRVNTGDKCLVAIALDTAGLSTQPFAVRNFNIK